MKSAWIAFALVMGAGPALAVEPASFSACITEADPPVCLVRKAIERDTQELSDVLPALIATGSLDLVLAHPTLAVDGARAKDEQARSEIVLAAVALVTASQRTDDPYADPKVQRLLAAADDDTTVAVIALRLWYDVELHWRTFDNTVPRGLGKVWAVVIANPPTDSEVVANLGTNAAWSGFRAEGMALFEIVTSRPLASPDAKAHAASDLARIYGRWADAQRMLDTGGAGAPGYDVVGIRVEIAMARLMAGYDADAARIVVEAEKARMPASPDYHQGESDALVALEAGGAKIELEQLARAYLTVARTPDAYRHDEWFALASDAYRRLGRRDMAVAVAREGVAEAVKADAEISFADGEAAKALSASEQQQLDRMKRSRRSWRSSLALYRAGQWGEALETGFITGTDRYRNAIVAGEAPDLRWVVDDRVWFEIESITLEIFEDGPASAARLYDLLVSERAAFADEYDSEWNRQLGLIAALAGRREAMLEHYARAAVALDRMAAKAPPDATDGAGYFALSLAIDWRKGERVLQGR